MLNQPPKKDVDRQDIQMATDTPELSDSPLLFGVKGPLNNLSSQVYDSTHTDKNNPKKVLLLTQTLIKSRTSLNSCG